jgi:uncharacterized repeat protein (TIGR04076 family)
MSQTVLFIDGGSRGSPGPAAAGVVLQTPAGEPIAEDCIFLGRMTSGAAEYHALIRGLQVAGTRGIKDIVIRTAADALVRQVRGEQTVRDPSLTPLQQMAGQLLRSFRQWRIEHVPRDRIARADALVRQELDRREGVRSGPSPAVAAPAAPAPAFDPLPTLLSPAGGVSAEPNAAGVPGVPSGVPASPGEVWAAVRAEVLKARPRAVGATCELAVGQTFDFARTTPAGVPLLVLAAVLPYVIALQRGARFDFPAGDGLQVSAASETGYYLIGLKRL